MKRLIFATVLCALALTGCASIQPAVPTVAAKADAVVLSAERAFGVAELAYATAADGVGLLVDAGVIHDATATKVRALNAQGRALLVRGKATADMAEKARIATQLFDLTDGLNALKGSK